MKKIISTALAVLCLTACVREKIDIPETQKEIAFGNSITAYATRSAGVVLDNSNLRAFYVHGQSSDI